MRFDPRSISDQPKAFGITENRLNQIRTVSKAHLRERYAGQLALVEEYITEVEGSGKSRDPTRWSEFTDAKRSTADMLERVDTAFEKRLNP